MTAVTLRSPWYCPYCNQASTRQWNISTHIRRKHPRGFNPFDLLKKTVELTDKYYKPRIQTISNISNSFRPETDWSDPQQLRESSTKIKNLLEESKNLSKLELAQLLVEIYSQMQAK